MSVSLKVIFLNLTFFLFGLFTGFGGCSNDFSKLTFGMVLLLFSDQVYVSGKVVAVTSKVYPAPKGAEGIALESAGRLAQKGRIKDFGAKVLEFLKIPAHQGGGQEDLVKKVPGVAVIQGANAYAMEFKKRIIQFMLPDLVDVSISPEVALNTAVTRVVIQVSH